MKCIQSGKNWATLNTVFTLANIDPRSKIHHLAKANEESRCSARPLPVLWWPCERNSRRSRVTSELPFSPLFHSTTTWNVHTKLTIYLLFLCSVLTNVAAAWWLLISISSGGNLGLSGMIWLKEGSELFPYLTLITSHYALFHSFDLHISSY